MNSLTEETSRRISSLRFLLIVLVVCIHNNLSADDALNYYRLAFDEPAAVTWFKQLVTGTLGGAAVPLFFLFAGYLQFCKRDPYPLLLKKRARSLLVPYVLWTLLSVLLFFTAQSFPQSAPFFQNPGNIVRDWGAADWVNLFWTHDDTYPFVYQFWFLRDLLVLTVISPVLHVLARKAPFAVLAGMTLCWLNGLPLGFGTALFFYMAGCFCAEYGIPFFALADKISWAEYAVLLLAASFLPFLPAESFALHGITTLTGCLFFLKLSGAIIVRPRLYAVAAYLAGFSFFLYAIHAPFLGTALNKISWRIIPLHGIGCLVQFVVPSLLCAALGTGIGIALKKFLPPVYGAFSGER